MQALVLRDTDHEQLSIAGLAELYCAQPRSAISYQECIEHARIELSKYDLEPDQLDEAAPVLARAICMLIEQNGGKDLNESLKRSVEGDVLEWCGCELKH